MRNNYSCLNSNRAQITSEKLPERYETDNTRLKKRRLCLKCGKKFLSIGPHNRLCEKCISINEKIALKTFYVSAKHINELNH